MKKKDTITIHLPFNRSIFLALLLAVGGLISIAATSHGPKEVKEEPAPTKLPIVMVLGNPIILPEGFAFEKKDRNTIEIVHVKSKAILNSLHWTDANCSCWSESTGQPQAGSCKFNFFNSPYAKCNPDDCSGRCRFSSIITGFGQGPAEIKNE